MPHQESNVFSYLMGRSKRRSLEIVMRFIADFQKTISWSSDDIIHRILWPEGFEQLHRSDKCVLRTCGTLVGGSSWSNHSNALMEAIKLYIWSAGMSCKLAPYSNAASTFRTAASSNIFDPLVDVLGLVERRKLMNNLHFWSNQRNRWRRLASSKLCGTCRAWLSQAVLTLSILQRDWRDYPRFHWPRLPLIAVKLFKKSTRGIFTFISSECPGQ